MKPDSSWGVLLIISDGLTTAFDHQKTLDEDPPSGVLQITFCVKTDNLPAIPRRLATRQNKKPMLIGSECWPQFAG
ncbi:hypothetical protein HF679_03320 [Enterobacter sp. JUb54]|uniref:hypothetical protein n=1 Tax=Enterobacter sp. JUb54 TaxID=2724468 RepID=UPI00164D06E8|nr:hypothetical protein [Enterobacter sp. JUb54]QNK08497.1 hypothetical protein HF679_03320 [Enterobacter sp. JUb54]